MEDNSVTEKRGETKRKDNKANSSNKVIKFSRTKRDEDIDKKNGNNDLGMFFFSSLLLLT